MTKCKSCNGSGEYIGLYKKEICSECLGLGIDVQIIKDLILKQNQSIKSGICSMIVGEPINIADPVYIIDNNKVGRAYARNLSCNVLGIALNKQNIIGKSIDIMYSGIACGILSNADSNTLYWLQTGGGIGKKVPDKERLFVIGFSINESDLFVRITDYGIRI
jgi:hypothetical protein